MKIIYSYLGGSFSYGLNTLNSDKDERGVFIHTDVSKIIGLNRHDHETKQSGGDDIMYFEFRHFLNLLNKGNTQSVELLWNNNWITKLPEFEILQKNRNKLIDSHKLFKCLKGYSYGERDLVNGTRTCLLGGKRKEHLDKFGYSYKNLIQFLRLNRAGEVFFQTGEFPVYIRDDKEIGDLLYDIKTRPENYNREIVNNLMDEWEKRLNDSYDNIKIVYSYDTKLANDLCFELYFPILEEYNLSWLLTKNPE